MQKRVMAINDLSCYGRCALSVTLPVLSAAGVECSVTPTAVLSTHLAYPNPVNISMTEHMPGINAHLKSIDVSFDAIAIGYLDNSIQQEIAMEFINNFKDGNTFVLADPTMADNGRMYGNKNFNREFVQGMKNIVKIADITLPNITEAAFLTGIEFKNPPYEKSYIEGLLHAVSAIGPKKTVITGVIFEDDYIGSVGLDRESGQIFYSFSKMYSGRFIGTGDLFAAGILGALLNNIDFKSSLEIATEFVSYSIEKTLKTNTKNSISINFEQSLPYYMKKLKLI